MKRILITMLVLLLLLTSTCFAKEFTDLDESHWAYPVITKMSKEGVLNGYPDGTFLPEQSVTRAEFSKILVLSLDLEGRSMTRFEDTPTSHWAYSYIEKASKYLEGSKIDNQNYFYPDEKAVREDITKAMVLAAGFQDREYDLDTLDQFSDKGLISKNMKKYVTIAVENELLRGNADGTFNPQGRLTRAEVCQVMFNIMEVLEEDARLKPTATSTPKPTKTVTPTVEPTPKPVATSTPTPTIEVTPTPIPEPTSAPTTELSGILGDVNNDGEVDSSDVNVLYRYVNNDFSEEEIEQLQIEVGDVNQDGVIDSQDVAILYGYMMGDIDKLPYTKKYVIYGDVNGDLSIDAKDVALLRRYLANEEEAIVEENADVNEDDKITNKDVLILRKYLAKEEGYEKLPYKGELITYGDVNDDGEVTEEDGTILDRYLAGWEGYGEQVNMKNADVDADGEVTMRDSVILARHLAGWEGYEELPYTK